MHALYYKLTVWTLTCRDNDLLVSLLLLDLVPEYPENHPPVSYISFEEVNHFDAIYIGLTPL